MDYEPIKKNDVAEMSLKPNLEDYEKARQSFNWDDVKKELDWFEDGRINIAYETIDRHVKTPLKDKVALFWEGRNGENEAYTFADMARLTSRFAGSLKMIGVEKGDRIFTFMDRTPEQYISLLGALKMGGVVGPLFSAFGPDAVKDRLEDCEARVLITTPRLIKTVHEIIHDLPALDKIIVVNQDNTSYELKDNEISYEDLMAGSSDDFEIEKTDKEDYAIIHYTSGTTGKPKGVVHAHEAIIGHYSTAKYILDLHPDDIYWCTADPGWVTGTSYGIFGPWSNGISQVIFEGGFGASAWYRVIEKYKVTVWYTAPTAIRMLMKAGEKVVTDHDMSSLRYMCSVGEPLNPEAVLWGRDVIGLPFHDNWWQTETGCIQIANYPIQDIHPGSMGKPFMPVTAAILDDRCEKEVPPGEEGHLVLKSPWPSMFRTYWNRQELYESRFEKGWYITGDRATMDETGYFWFVGRADDVINTGGHLVGPFEVESALIEHPAVAEAGVIGIPDPIATEVIKAFVSLKDGYETSDELLRDIKRFARKKLHALSCPRQIEFISGLPKTKSGKIMRRLLKARELGLPEGDTSTLEE
ncbi:MAG: acetate--CoA ligase [Deltaproteobacteria bacterium]|nr:acetate--CoA ligase [Deltaproteobacteria bacterium]MBW2139815.1 acetate--CoA ligase [Deltaproteobacteria bacterium]MBW2322164.1 acetate--CoA ligase [Deltaproteobacteria bacterium]